MKIPPQFMAQGVDGPVQSAAFIGPADKTAWRLTSKSYPWVVCCYASIGAKFNHDQRQWLVPPNSQPSWEVFYRWKLIDIKVFRSRQEAFDSRSYNRHYAPFDHDNVVVVLRYNKTIRASKPFCTLPLYPSRSGPAR